MAMLKQAEQQPPQAAPQAAQPPPQQAGPPPGQGAPAPKPAGGAPRPARGDLSDMNTPASPKKGKAIADSKVRRGSGLQGPEQEATEEEQAELERAVGALGKVLYEDDSTSQAIQDQLRPEERIGSMAKASILLIKNLDEKLDFDEDIVAQFTQEVADRVIDMYENKVGEEVSEGDAQKVLGATWEGVMEMFGVDEDSYEEMTQGMTDEDLDGYTEQFNQFLEAE